MQRRSQSLFSLAFLALISCTTGVKGSGKGAKETRSVDAFTEIEVQGAIDVRFAAGPTGVTLEGDDNLLPLIVTQVVGQRLVISTKEDLNPSVDLVATLSGPSLTAFICEGATDAKITGLEGESFSLEIAGAADVKLSGATKSFNVEVNGAGNVSAAELVVEKAKVSINGAGDATIHVTDTLDAEINGAGNMTYTGKPKTVNREVNGIGSINAG